MLSCETLIQHEKTIIKIKKIDDEIFFITLVAFQNLFIVVILFT